MNPTHPTPTAHPFRLSALPAEPFAPLFALEDHDLAARGIRRVVVDAKPATPCRVSLEDAEVGETVLLLPYQHQGAASPYRASGAIFVRPGVRQAFPGIGEVPTSVRCRLLSVRAYGTDGMMLGAEVAEGRDVETIIARFFGDAAVDYLHLHNARPGCYACRVDRA